MAQNKTDKISPWRSYRYLGSKFDGYVFTDILNNDEKISKCEENAADDNLF